MTDTRISGSGYPSCDATTVKKADAKNNSVSTKEGEVTTSTVELKTSRPGVTKTEQIKTGYSNVNDYSKYLQGKYSYMNTGLTSMQGIPTTVSVSGAFLQKCMNDPEKAKYLEENLAAIPDCTKSAIHGCLGTLTNQSYTIDANGNITETASGTNDPDGTIARENAKRKAEEQKKQNQTIKEKREEKRIGKKRQEERTKKIKEEKKVAAEKLERQQAEKEQDEANAAQKTAQAQTYEIRITGKDMADVTAKLTGIVSPSYAGAQEGRSQIFDVMA